MSEAAAIRVGHAPLCLDQPVNQEEIQPDGGYGWICAAACFIFNAFTWGSVSSYGVYLSYYLSHNTYPHANDIDFAFIGGFNLSIAMVVAPLATDLASRLGPRPVIAIGIILESVAYIAASFCSQVWHLYLSQGFLVGFGIGFIYVPSLPIISQWFSKKRSLANGISASGSGFGGMFFSWTTGVMLQHIGLRWTLRATGLMTLMANSIAVLLIRHRNHIIKPPQVAFDMNLLRRVDVALLLSWAFVSMIGYTVLLFSLPDFAISIGLSHAEATNIVGFLNMGTAVGRPIIGIISDRCSRIDTAAVITLVCGLSCVAIWIPSISYGLTIFFSIVCGAILGVFWMTIGPLCVEVVGLEDLQSVLSLSWMSIILPTAFSETLGLKLRRMGSSRPYLYPQVLTALSYITASAFLFTLRWVKGREHRLSQSP